MPKGICKFEGCVVAVIGKGYCASHYKRWRKGLLPKARYKICSSEGCRKPRAVRAKCEEHSKTKPAAGEVGATVSA